ncbi:MAG: primosomal replication protein N [Burkholderiales bacterium]
MNQVRVRGRLIELGALRHTPAGIAAIEFRLCHESEQTEAGAKRQVSAEIPAIAFDVQARLLAACALERALQVEGFLAAKSRRSKKLVLHATHIEFAEGE